MGVVVELEAHRAARPRAGLGAGPAAEVFFDPACPSTYLAAERVERLFARAAWTPVGPAPRARPADRTVERRAGELRLPLSWPEPMRIEARGAARAAAYAAEQGRGGSFVLAVARLTFGGGFDPDAPRTLAEAAAAARLDVRGCLRAAADERRDAGLLLAAERLRRLGAERLPAVLAGGRLYCGEERLAAAAVADRPARIPA